MREVNSYQLSSSNVITLTVPPAINRASLNDFKRKIVSIMVNDMLKVFLRNAYYKRPILVLSPDSVCIHLDKPFYVFKAEVEKLLEKWASFSQALSIIELTPVTANKVILTEFYVKNPWKDFLSEYSPVEELPFTGNEARKFSKRKLNEIREKLLCSSGALFRLECMSATGGKHFVLGHSIFVPLEKSLEFL
ncbi:hypothetical protein P8X24_10905 [Pyrococcus kukulkanii]|uniref:hypothetical protein n=1 Tax=Pyrococcus kukulkanii TaxID=1609559 RepID=UPI00356403E7